MDTAQPLASPTHWKTASNGLIAHIYEHVIAARIDESLYNQGFFRVTDYDMWPRTYSTTVFLETRFHETKAKSAYLYELQAKSKITPTETEKAVRECACEYQRNIKHLDISSLAQELQQLHRSGWQPISTFKYEVATNETSVNTLFETSSIGYTSVKPDNYTTIVCEYTAPTHLYKNVPHIKALAVLITQAAALNHSLRAIATLACYDSGDEWADGADEVGYRIYFRLPAPGEISTVIQQLEDIFTETLRTMTSMQLATKIARLVGEVYQDENRQYFDTETLNTILGGIIIGGKGWKDASDLETINGIINAIELQITH